MVFLTDMQADETDIETMRTTLKAMCSQGGLMILRFYETNNFNKEAKSRDQIEEAFEVIKSAIAVYPSKRIPIIQEEFAF